MKMKNKIIAAIIVALFLASLIPMNTISAFTPITNPIIGMTHPKLEAPADPDNNTGLDGSAFLENAYVEGLVPMLTPQSPWTVAVSDDYYGGTYNLDFTNVLNGTHCNIWVGLSPDVWYSPDFSNSSKDEWFLNGTGFADDMFFFAYPWSWRGGAFWGASRLKPGYRDYIFGSQLIQLMNEFDSNMWQTCRDYFGLYADRPGPFNDYKIQILIFNIRDQLFYDPLGGTSFIEGYFWSYISNLYQANIIHIDTYQWFRRQGPTPDGGQAAYLVSPSYPSTSRYPYEYEGAFAHEYQHLIHRDVDSDELSWVNEGCASLAQYVCGYGITSNLAYYITRFWYTSLVIWEGSLANYGGTFLFALYMSEQYGAKFMYDVVHEQANGIEGYNKVLTAYHIGKDFDQIFQDWAIANYLDNTSIYNGIYGYYGLDLPCKESSWYDIPTVMQIVGAYSPWPLYPAGSYPDGGYLLGAGMPYTVNYWRFDDGAPVLQVDFYGDAAAGVPAHSPTHEWWSDGGAYSWFQLGHTFAVPGTGATLKFWSNYDIEEDWDYGYVEVHDLTTDTWTTLPGVQTISTLPNPQDNPNTPASFEPTSYFGAGTWNAFTGNSGGWYEETMSLAPFGGHSIELYFTYWTDPYTTMGGWYVDDIQIPEIGFSDNVESGVGGWTVNAGWEITTGIVPNNFKVNFIREIDVAVGSSTTVYSIVSMKLDSAQEGSILLPCMTTCPNLSFGPHVMVVANQPGYEHVFSTDFWFWADTTNFPPHPP